MTGRATEQREEDGEQAAIVCVAAAIHSGELLEELPASELRDSLEGLAMTLPELFAVDASCLDRLAERLGDAPTGQAFSEVLLMSEHHLHVAQPLAHRPGVALLAVSPAPTSVGLVLSHMHAHSSKQGAG